MQIHNILKGYRGNTENNYEMLYQRHVKYIGLVLHRQNGLQKKNNN